MLLGKDNLTDASQTLQDIISSDNTVNVILLMIGKVWCQIEAEQIDEAIVTSTEVVSFVEGMATTTELESIKDDIFKKLESLCMKFVKLKCIDSVFSLVNCLTCLVKNVYKTQSQLIKFNRIGSLMKDLGKKLYKQNKQEQIKQLFSLFDEIFQTMQMISDVDLDFKFIKMGLFLSDYGYCCNKAIDFTKSEIIHSQAISMIETYFGINSMQYQVLGKCYYNLGCCYEKSNRLVEAKAAYQKAVNIAKQATDFSDESKKQNCISLSVYSLKKVEDKL